MYHLPFRIEIYVLAYIRVGARQAAAPGPKTAPRRSTAAPLPNSPETTRKCIPAFPVKQYAMKPTCETLTPHYMGRTDEFIFSFFRILFWSLFENHFHKDSHFQPVFYH